MSDLPETPDTHNTPSTDSETAEPEKVDALLESREAREKERRAWEEAERQKKIEERKKLEEERLELERRHLYQQLDHLDFSLLSLEDYPTDHELYTARRARNLWFVTLGSALFLLLASIFSLTSAWIGGIVGGIIFVLWLTHGSGMIALFPSLNRYNDLILERKHLKNQWREYVQTLEGQRSFCFRIYPLVEFNARLEARRFRRIAVLSREHHLLGQIKSLKDAAILAEYFKEAQRAYQELLLREKEDALAAAMAPNEDSTEATNSTSEASAESAPANSDLPPASET